QKLRAYGGLIKQVPAILADRKTVQASRRVGDREILAHMTADVIFAGYQVGWMNQVFNRFSRGYKRWLEHVVV
ncbi:hypothetical protein HY523_02015, partial [Candidatus Berkelbacteria bacterium]|nr:hypothetical protein [Candidatus Berkelbacteria bacterium]